METSAETGGVPVRRTAETFCCPERLNDYDPSKSTKSALLLTMQFEIHDETGSLTPGHAIFGVGLDVTAIGLEVGVEQKQLVRGDAKFVRQSGAGVVVDFHVLSIARITTIYLPRGHVTG